MLAAALWLGACGGKPSPPADDALPDSAAAARAAAEEDSAPPEEVAPPGDSGPAARPMTPEEDSIREERAFRRRKQSMESYDSCMAKAAAVEEPVRTVLTQACARSRSAPR